MKPERPPLWKRILVPRSLRRQLLSRSLAILAVLLVLIGTFQYWFMKDFALKNKADAMRSQLEAIPKDLFFEQDRRFFDDKASSDNAGKSDGSGVNDGTAPSGSNGSGSSNRPDRMRRPLLLVPESSLATIDNTGTLTAAPIDTDSSAPPELSKEEYLNILKHLSDKKQDPAYRIVTDKNGEEQLLVFHGWGPPGQQQMLLQMSMPTEEIQHAMIQQLMLFLGLSAFALLAGLFLSLPVMKRTLVPLSNIGSAVQKIDAGNLSVRLPVRQGQEEIDRLSESFNGMLERLEASFRAEREAKETMRRFAADASHELRTPLTSIHGFLEILLRGAAEKPEQLYSALNSMYGESKRINKLVEDLLLLAKLDRAPELRFREVSLKELLTEMEPQLRILAGQRAVRFDVDEVPYLSLDPDKIKQVVLNLFNNAVQHTNPESGAIELRLYRFGEEMRLGVKDNGTGIGEEHLPHLFDRFYRSESSRNRRSGGAGLGLAISKSIVEAHGGHIGVESRLGEGTLFQVRLPVTGTKPGSGA